MLVHIRVVVVVVVVPVLLVFVLVPVPVLVVVGEGVWVKGYKKIIWFLSLSLFLSPRLVGANQRMVCTPFSGLASQTYPSSRQLFVPLVQPIVAPDTIADLFSLGTSWCPSSIFAPIYFSS